MWKVFSKQPTQDSSFIHQSIKIKMRTLASALALIIETPSTISQLILSFSTRAASRSHPASKVTPLLPERPLFNLVLFWYELSCCKGEKYLDKWGVIILRNKVLVKSTSLNNNTTKKKIKSTSGRGGVANNCTIF